MDMKYKAVIADIDGTVTKKGETPMEATLQALIRCHEAGLDVGLATGRPLDHRIFGKAEEWNLGFPFDVLIGMNGGELWDRYTGKIEREYMLDEDSLRDILSFMMKLDVNAIIFADGYDYVKATRTDRQLESSIRRNRSRVEFVAPEELCTAPACKLEFHYDPSVEEELYRVISEHPDPRWSAVKTFPGTVEFMDPRVDKGSALRKYCMHAGIPAEAVIACGDMENDIGMMKEAGLGVCLQNGSEAARASADAVTEHPVWEDGLGRWFFKNLFPEDQNL
jgi:Cof subfamily protein (haloacid dehalogenase superfamily)